jgi:hypothetical protein
VLGAPYVIPGLVAELSDPTSDKIEVLIDGASYVSGMAASSGMVDGVSFGIAGADWLHESYRHGFGSRGAAFKILQLVAQGAVVGAGWSGHPILAALGHGAVFTLKLGEITYKLSEKRVGAMASGAASFGYNAQMQVTAPSTGQPLSSAETKRHRPPGLQKRGWLSLSADRHSGDMGWRRRNARGWTTPRAMSTGVAAFRHDTARSMGVSGARDGGDGANRARGILCR